MFIQNVKGIVMAPNHSTDWFAVESHNAAPSSSCVVFFGSFCCWSRESERATCHLIFHHHSNLFKCDMFSFSLKFFCCQAHISMRVLMWLFAIAWNSLCNSKQERNLLPIGCNLFFFVRKSRNFMASLWCLSCKFCVWLDKWRYGVSSMHGFGFCLRVWLKICFSVSFVFVSYTIRWVTECSMHVWQPFSYQFACKYCFSSLVNVVFLHALLDLRYTDRAAIAHGIYQAYRIILRSFSTKYLAYAQV